MQKVLKYTIFKTKWGYFGLAATDNALCRTCLPLSKSEKVKRELLDTRFWILDACRESSIENRASSIEFDKNLLKTLQEQITAYFEGEYIYFSRDIALVLDGFSPFSRSVLFACRKVEYGQVITYSGLADKVGRVSAARAIGNILARNPVPLIIPCHRVVRSDGKLGGFSAPGGKNIKRRLLELERSTHKIAVS